METFIKVALPVATVRERALAADLVGLVVSSVSKSISSQNRSPSDVNEIAVAVGEMLCGYLTTEATSRMT
jgi:hypothetical protein